MSRVLTLLIAVVLVVLTEARNRGPPVRSNHPLAFKPPSTAISGQLQRRQLGNAFSDKIGSKGFAPELLGSDDFSWFDPLLQQHLWAAAAGGEKATKQQLMKRNTTKPARIGEPLYQADCLGCIKSGFGLDEDTNKYTWQYMQEQMLIKPPLRDSCIFYTGLTDADKKQLLASPNSIYFGLSEVKDQSRASTVYACQKSIKSIWMLWPGMNEHYAASQSTITKRNYYEVREGSWLSPVYSDAATRKHYFTIMSQAMAESCTGVTYVMSVQLENMAIYENIWPTTEYPTLQRLKANGVVTRLIGIDAKNPNNQYEMTFQNPPQRGAQLTTADPAYVPFIRLNDTTDESLAKRDSCTANLDYSDATPYDWFG